jgi:hypothetical protein
LRIVSSISLPCVVIGVFVSVPALADDVAPPPAPPPVEDRASVAASSRLAPADALRERGTVVLDDVAGGTLGTLGVTLGWFTLQSSTSEHDGQKSKSTMFQFAPSADVFVTDGLSIGGLVGIGRATQNVTGTQGMPGSFESSSTSRRIEPRVGYAFRLSDDLVFWPRLRLGHAWSDTDLGPGATGVLGATSSTSTSSRTWSAGGDASLVFVLGRHAAIAAGPQLTYSHAESSDGGDVSTSVDLGIHASLRVMF